MKTIKYLSIVCLIFYPLFIRGVSYNEEFQVNTYTNSGQSNPNVTGLANGTFVVCWVSEGQDGSSYGIYGQLFNASGERIGQEFQVNTYTENGQCLPSVAGLADDTFVVCWTSDDQDGSNRGIFGQLFYASGERIGQEFQVNTYTNGYQGDPSVAGLADSTFVVCWTSINQYGSSYEIYGQLFSNSAEKLGSEFQVNTYTEDGQSDPSVTRLSDSTFVVCWNSWWQDGSCTGIYGQLFINSAEKLGSEFQVNTYTYYNQDELSMAVLPDGTFVVCWRSQDQDGSDSGIYAQLFNAAAEKIGQEFQVNTYIFMAQWAPSVAGFSDDKFVICWVCNDHGRYGEGVFGQLFNESGERIGQEFKVNTHAERWKRYPTVTGLVDGKFVVCWESEDQDGSKFGIFGKYYLPDPLVHDLTDFELIQPQNDATVNRTNPTFFWNKATKTHFNFSWELTYDIYLDTDINFSDPRIIAAIQDTIFQIDALSPGQSYYWKVLAKNVNGDSLWSSNINGFFVTNDARPNDIEENETILPEGFGLEQNYPNPFNPTTTIPITLPNKSNITINIYNTLGQKVATVVNNQSFSPGRHKFTFDGSNLASGVYIISAQILSENKLYQFNKKMLLLR